MHINIILLCHNVMHHTYYQRGKILFAVLRNKLMLLLSMLATVNIIGTHWHLY